MIDRSEVHFADTVMVFAHYSFRAASVISDPTLHTSQIRDVDPTSCPPEVRTVDGDTLFGVLQRLVLRQAVAENPHGRFDFVEELVDLVFVVAARPERRLREGRLVDLLGEKRAL